LVQESKEGSQIKNQMMTTREASVSQQDKGAVKTMDGWKKKMQLWKRKMGRIIGQKPVYEDVILPGVDGASCLELDPNQ
jgi:hypothetical protein